MRRSETEFGRHLETEKLYGSIECTAAPASGLVDYQQLLGLSRAPVNNRRRGGRFWIRKHGPGSGAAHAFLIGVGGSSSFRVASFMRDYGQEASALDAWLNRAPFKVMITYNGRSTIPLLDKYQLNHTRPRSRRGSSGPAAWRAAIVEATLRWLPLSRCKESGAGVRRIGDLAGALIPVYFEYLRTREARACSRSPYSMDILTLMSDGVVPYAFRDPDAGP